MEQFDLTPGHIHQAAASNGLHCITIYPTPTPERWHVSVPGRGLRENVPIEDVVAVLDSWDIRPKAEWSHWPGEPRERIR